MDMAVANSQLEHAEHPAQPDAVPDARRPSTSTATTTACSARPTATTRTRRSGPARRTSPATGSTRTAAAATPRTRVLKRTIAYKLGYGNAFTVFSVLKVKPARKGDRIKFSCKGKGCTRKKAKVKVKKNRPAVSLTRYVKDAQLKPGTRIELRITHSNSVGSFRRFTIRSGKLPKQTRRCLPPGVNKPAKC